MRGRGDLERRDRGQKKQGGGNLRHARLQRTYSKNLLGQNSHDSRRAGRKGFDWWPDLGENASCRHYQEKKEEVWGSPEGGSGHERPMGTWVEGSRGESNNLGLLGGQLSGKRGGGEPSPVGRI